MQEERLERRADQIEKELRDAIAVEPYPFYTDLEVTCDFCYRKTTRVRVKLVKDPNGIFDDCIACLSCIDTRNLTLSNSEKALDFEARTIAILRIRKSTQVELPDESIERR